MDATANKAMQATARSSLRSKVSDYIVFTLRSGVTSAVIWSHLPR